MGPFIFRGHCQPNHREFARSSPGDQAWPFSSEPICHHFEILQRSLIMANLRYRTARDEADRLGQVFTPIPIAELLAASFPLNSTSAFHVLDLGAGQGVLANAVLARYRHAKASMVEVDEKQVSLLRGYRSNRSRVIHADVLDAAWECATRPTVIISNPPYGTLKASDSLKSQIESVGLAIPFNGRWVRGDAAFIAKAWAVSDTGTHFGLIVASPLIRNLNYQPMRERFVKELRGLCVTQLNPLTFKNAEVNTYLLTGERTVRRRRNVLLRKASTSGEVVEEIEVSQEEAIASLDIDTHLLLRRRGPSPQDTLYAAESAIFPRVLIAANTRRCHMISAIRRFVPGSSQNRTWSVTPSGSQPESFAEEQGAIRRPADSSHATPVAAGSFPRSTRRAGHAICVKRTSMVGTDRILPV